MGNWGTREPTWQPRPEAQVCQALSGTVPAPGQERHAFVVLCLLQHVSPMAWVRFLLHTCIQQPAVDGLMTHFRCALSSFPG